jgi:hypothetical protein
LARLAPEEQSDLIARTVVGEAVSAKERLLRYANPPAAASMVLYIRTSTAPNPYVARDPCMPRRALFGPCTRSPWGGYRS